jgi:RHS repeat-associated protein
MATPSGAVAWGWNEDGQLGNGSAGGSNPFPEPVDSVGEIRAVAEGGGFSLALLSNGTVEAWGDNTYGQLGNGTTTSSVSPVTVSGLTGVTAISAGGYHALALLSNGTVEAWGANEYGQLGSGNTTSSDVPAAVSELGGVTAVSGGHFHSLALLSNGTVKAWGRNELGELGNGGGGESSESSVPVAVSGLTGVKAISAGDSHSMALLTNGTVMDWGSNQTGQLGTGTTTGPEHCPWFGGQYPCAKKPVAVTGLTGVSAISDATSSSVLLSTGAVKDWGGNGYGQLGDGTSAGPEKCSARESGEVTFACSTVPVAVSGLTSGAAAISRGDLYAGALMSNGTVKTWGINERGELGAGTRTGPETCSASACSKTPVEVAGLSGVAGISTGALGEGFLAYGAEFAVGVPPPPIAAEEGFGEGNPADPQLVRACAGKPVSCASGNESQTQTDLTVRGRGIPLTFSRTYNAQATVNQSTPGTLGYGWTSTFSDHLVVNSEAGTDTVVQANGSTAVFKSTGLTGEQTAPVWAQAKLSLNTDGTYLYTLPDQQSLHFDASGRLLSEADRNGNTTTMSRNGEGRLESVTDAAGRKLTFAYNAEGEIESAQDPMGHTVKYTYEGGNLASVTLPGEASPRWQLKYDGSHRLTALIDGRGGVTTNEYDSSNRVIKQKDPLEHILRFEYAAASTKMTNEATGAVTEETFTSGGEPTEIVRGAGSSVASSEAFVYTASGAPERVWNGNGRATQYGYDSAGNRTKVIDADGNETKWAYNSTHDVISTTTPKGETTTIKRDGHGNAETVERPAPASKTQVTKFKYNSLGELEAITDPLERTWKYEYDTQGDRAAEVDPEGDKQTWTYNTDSQETASVSPRGNVSEGEPAKYATKTERDAQGRPLAIIDPLGHETKYSYDGNGNVETETDENGHTRTYTYDADNERTKIKAPNGTITETGYDGAGEVTRQLDGNKHETKYVRNTLEQVTEVIDPLNRKTNKAYDGAGNVKTVIDPAKRTITYSYDAANRLKELSYSESSTHAVKYEYDADGDRTSMTDGTGTSTNTFDQLDRLAETKDGHGDVTKYEYDIANQQTKIIYPSGKAVTRAFDKAGRLGSVTDWLEHTTKFAYSPDSQLAATTFPSGTSNVDKYTYNGADQMSEVVMTKAAETLGSLLYSRDNDGQVKTVTSKGLPGEEKPSYEYDANNRLSKGAGLAYEYDAANSPTNSGSSLNTFDSADELKTGTGVAYSYDELGERTKRTPTSGAAFTYGYDQAGDLTSVTRPKEGKAAELKDTYAYDGRRLRVSQTIGNTTAVLTWNVTAGMPLLLGDGANSYIYGPGDVPVEQISSGGTVLYLHHDQQGSTRLVTSATGANEAAFTYDPFGNTTGTNGTAKTPLGYDGQYTSADTGLIYLRARTYDPSTAQLLTIDPAASLTRAPYTYAGDNPINTADPTGLWAPKDAQNAIENSEAASEFCETAAEQREFRRDERAQTREEEEMGAEERAREGREANLKRLKEQVARENYKEQQELAREGSGWPDVVVKAAKAVGGCLVGGDVGMVGGGAVGAEVGGPAGALTGAGVGGVVGCVSGAVGAVAAPVNPLEPSEGGP